jgi:hypothetical protein
MSPILNVLCIGDIVGSPGRQMIRDCLPQLKKNHGIDFVIANVEKLHNILYNGKASTNTTIKMVLFLLENPEYIDSTLFVKNPSIIKREMKL